MPVNVSSRRPLGFANPFFFATLFAVTLGCVTTSAKPEIQSLRPIPIVSQHEVPGTRDIQVADEIVRRLRRLGINFNKSRLPRPYDPEGELC